MDIQVNLDRLNKEDAFSVAISLLYSLKDLPQFSVVSELPYLIKYEDFIKVVKYYGGETIRIPTIDEVNDIMRVLLLYQYYNILENSWEDSLRKSGFKSEESRSARASLSHLIKIFKNQEIGGRSYE